LRVGNILRCEVSRSKESLAAISQHQEVAKFSPWKRIDKGFSKIVQYNRFVLWSSESQNASSISHGDFFLGVGRLSVYRNAWQPGSLHAGTAAVQIFDACAALSSDLPYAVCSKEALLDKLPF
jgi:hypothetical protein